MKESDDSNLMWLLDFRVDSLFTQEEQQQSLSTPSANANIDIMAFSSSATQDGSNLNSSATSTHHDTFTVNLEDVNVIDNVANYELVETAATTDPNVNYESGVKQPEKKDNTVDIDEHGKPRCTYTELIEKALTETGGLTVSEIYQWISNRYPYFRPDDDRWKNSVRHNLSINPYFKKGQKARNGAGHLWAISEEVRNNRIPSRRKSSDNIQDLDLPMPMISETDRAVASILGQYNLERANQLEQEKRNSSDPKPQPVRNHKPLITVEPDEEINMNMNELDMPIEQVPVVDSLPPGTYTIEEVPVGSLFSLDELTDAAAGRLIFVSEEEANKENIDAGTSTMILNLNEGIVSEFPIPSSASESSQSNHHHDILAAAMEEVNNSFTSEDSDSFSKIPDRCNNETFNPVELMEMEPNSDLGNDLHEKSDSARHVSSSIRSASPSQDLMLLESMDMSSIILEHTIDSVDSGNDDRLGTTFNDHFFEAKELGFVYAYDNQGDPVLI